MRDIAGVVGQSVQRNLSTQARMLRDHMSRYTIDHVGIVSVDSKTSRIENLSTGTAESDILIASAYSSHDTIKSTIDSPSFDALGRFIVALNGSIYNHRQIVENLIGKGICFNERSSQQAILAGINHYGISYLKELVGCYAVAIVDLVDHKLYLGRDLFGIKTIYYSLSSVGVSFASNLSTLLGFSNVPRTPNPSTLHAFLRHGSMNQSGQTLFLDIHQILPGETLSFDLSAPYKAEHHSIQQINLSDEIDISFEEASRRFRDYLSSSVQLHSDTPANLGASLSGGNDSSAIVMILNNQRPSMKLDTFSFVTPGFEYINEEKWIDLINDRINGTSHKISTNARAFVAELPAIVRYFGEPPAGASQFVQNKVYEAIHEAGIRISLDGIGGDAVTVGHAYFLVDRFYELVSSRNVQDAGKLFISLLSNPALRSSKSILLHALTRLPLPLQLAIRKLARQEEFPVWLDTEWFVKRNVQPVELRSFQGKRPLQRHMLDVIRNDTLMRVAERNASFHGAESRQPFLYAPLVEFVLSLPAAYLIADSGNGRRLFRHAMRGIVPDDILDRKDKIGFQPPESHWLVEENNWFMNILNDAIDIGFPVNAEILRTNLSRGKPSAAAATRIAAAIVWAKEFNIQFPR